MHGAVATIPSLETQAVELAESYRPPATGRPSALGDPDTLKELLKQLALGNRREVACQLAGISQQTLRNWQAKANESPNAETPERAFLDLVKRAEAVAEARIVGNVLKASEKEQFWAAGMTYLERKYPESWGRRQDDSSGPKVVVQIGIKDSDVAISAITTAPVTAIPTDSPQANLLKQHKEDVC